MSKLCNDGKFVEYIYEDCRTMYEAFLRGKRVSENGPCLGHRFEGKGDYVWSTYAEILHKAQCLGSALIDRGLKPGGKTCIGIFCKNRPEVCWSTEKLAFILLVLKKYVIFRVLGWFFFIITKLKFSFRKAEFLTKFFCKLLRTSFISCFFTLIDYSTLIKVCNKSRDAEKNPTQIESKYMSRLENSAQKADPWWFFQVNDSALFRTSIQVMFSGVDKTLVFSTSVFFLFFRKLDFYTILDFVVCFVGFFSFRLFL